MTVFREPVVFGDVHLTIQHIQSLLSGFKSGKRTGLMFGVI